MVVSAENDTYCNGGVNPEDIVISGMSGRFPGCSNIQEFKELLLSNKRPPSEADKRFRADCFEKTLPLLTIKDVAKFDGAFFDFSDYNIISMDPQTRILFEVTYEAIVDAGYDPASVRGKKVGVYCGLHTTDSYDLTAYSDGQNENFMEKSVRCYYGNHISYTFDFKGPSNMLSSNCSSSLDAIMQAHDDIAAGVCTHAVVISAQLTFLPQRLKFLIGAYAPETSSSSDHDDNFYFGESVGALFLQKSDSARRIHATIASISQTHDGYPSEGQPMSQESIEDLFRLAYKNTKISPLDVSYLECDQPQPFFGHVAEKNAIKQVFCKSRTDALYVGAIKRNIGHCGACSGLCAVIKVILCMENNLLFPTIDNQDHSMYEDSSNKLKVVTESMPWSGQYISLNNFGIGGVMFHLCLKKNPVTSLIKACELPRLACFPSRTEKGVNDFFEFMDQNTLPEEFYSILNKTNLVDIRKIPYRGYKLENGKPSSQSIAKVENEKRPLWFVFNSFGVHWPGMGMDLMKFEVFAESMKYSAKILKDYGWDLFDFLRPTSSSLMKNRCVLPSTASVMSIQIALIDLLSSLGLKPDGLLGLSLGDVVSTYSLGFSREGIFRMLVAFADASESQQVPEGQMFSVGLSLEEARERCPPDIYIACHTELKYVTVAGATAPMNKFIAELKREGVSVFENWSSGYPVHCPLYEKACNYVTEKLIQEGFDERVPFAPGYVKTFRRDGEPDADINVDYFMTSLCHPAYFYEAVKEIPKNAVTIEIGPRQVFQRILKNTVGEDSITLGLMDCNVDSASYLLSTIGKLYTLGYCPQIENLYPPSRFPVPASVPLLSNFVQWSHEKDYRILEEPKVWWDFDIPNAPKSLLYLKDYCIFGKYEFPASGYLVLAWQASASFLQTPFADYPVLFEDVKFFPNASSLYGKGQVRMSVQILHLSHGFEVHDNGVLVASGKICPSKSPMFENPCPLYVKRGEMNTLNQDNYYHEFSIQGYEYGDSFKEVAEADVDGSQGLIKWKNNWVTFLNSLITFPIISDKSIVGCCVPKSIKMLKIDPIVLQKFFDEEGCIYKDQKVPVYYEKFLQRCSSSGVEINYVEWEKLMPIVPADEFVTEAFKFVPYNNVFSDELEFLDKYISLCVEEANKFSTNSKNKKAIDFIDNFSCKDNMVLLSTLHSLIDGASETGCLENANEIIKSYISNMENDALSNHLIRNQSVKIIFDIIEENIEQQEKVMLEVNNNRRNPLTFKIIPALRKKGWKFAVTDASSSTRLNQVVLDSNNIQFIEWSKRLELQPTVVIGSFLHGDKQNLERYIQSLAELTKENFVLLLYKSNLTLPEDSLQNICNSKIDVHSVDILEKVLRENKMIAVAKHSDSLSTHLYLLKKSSTHKKAIVHVVSENLNTLAPKLKSELGKLDSGSSLWIVDRNPCSGIIGLINSLRHEKGAGKLRCIFICEEDSMVPSKFDSKDKFYSNVFKKDMVFNVYKKGVWGCYNKVFFTTDMKKTLSSDFTLGLAFPGDLNSFLWTQTSSSETSSADNLCQVYYAGLSYYDIQNALQKTHEKAIPLNPSSFGYEFSGRKSNGQRVFGLGKNAMSSHIKPSEYLTWTVPSSWTLREACTIPISYAVAFYSLIVQAKLKNGSKVLIHCGSGGIGQASITIALSMNCEVFTTVGSESKKEFLLKKFPKLQLSHIGCSRDTSFVQTVLALTKDRGVDVLLTPLSGAIFEATMKCLASYSNCLITTHKKILKTSKIGMAVFFRNISLHTVNIFDVLENKWPEDRTVMETLHGLIENGISSGLVKPLDSKIFNAADVQSAFQSIALAQHHGKVLIKIQDEEPEKIIKPKSAYLEVVTNAFSSQKTCLIVGGEEYLSLAVANWLIHSGITKITISLTKKNCSALCKFYKEKFENQGVTCIFTLLDPSDSSSVEKLFTEATHLSPIGSIFNLGMISLTEKNSENFDERQAKSLNLTVLVDNFSRKMCPELDYFVCFSSVSEPNHCTSNSHYESVIERICEDRQKHGLHGMVIYWGKLGMQTHQSSFAVNSLYPAQSFPLCFSAFPSLIRQGKPTVYSYFQHANTCEPRKNIDDIFTQLYCYLNKHIERKPTDTLKEPVISVYNKDFKPIMKMNDESQGDIIFIIVPPRCTQHIIEFSESIGFPVYAVQLNLEDYKTSVADIAQSILKKIKRNFSNESFHIMGYDFGALIAYELALQTEIPWALQKLKSVTFVETKDSLKNIVLPFDNSDLGDICTFLSPLLSDSPEKFKESLNGRNGNKIGYLAQSILDLLRRNEDLVEFCTVLELECLKREMMRSYSPSSKLMLNSLLIEDDSEKDFKEKYCLDKVCQGEIETFTVSKTSHSILTGDACQSVIQFLKEKWTQ